MKSSLSLCMIASILSSKAMAGPTPGQDGLFRLPPGSKDGFYLHSVDANGIASTEYLGLANVTSISPDLAKPDTLSKRDSEGSRCQGNYVNPVDWDGAVDGLLGYCNFEESFSKAISYQSGNAVAYGCSYGGLETCRTWEVNPMITALKRDCGNQQQGFYTKPSWKVSYGVTSVGNSYC
ncbi:uncharacterized protein ALTATR162_LOCUS5025 [Alternaria atra]|uniref:Secreted protein n=1 Tax=Alternaria atra TaxID=119953 RepID=A0A8J2I289_9PLEO|nr:uncharacterized protein ALTATR162_LOCUS5025 [Alternaria atra]CAG5158180.1 unnamed protein product [Alternaria atra]